MADDSLAQKVADTTLENQPLSDEEVEKQYALLTENIQEVLGEKLIRAIIRKRPLRLYWGTATTGRPHAGYYCPAIKIAQFLKAGCKVKVLLADVHAGLDADKAPKDVLEYRAQYYERVIKALLRSVGVDLSNLEFVRGSSFQNSLDYNLELREISKKVTMREAEKACSEVVKSMGAHRSMGDGIYPMMQCLDEKFLEVDAQFGGVDQRKIFVLSHDVGPRVGWKPKAHLMNPMVPGLAGGKMSSSDPKSKIDLLDTEAVLTKKVRKAFCPPKILEENGVTSFIQHVALPYTALHTADGKPSISVTPRGAEAPLTFTSWESLATAYQADELQPQDVKEIAREILTQLNGGIRKEFEEDAEWQEINKRAYPNDKLA